MNRSLPRWLTIAPLSAAITVSSLCANAQPNNITPPTISRVVEAVYPAEALRQRVAATVHLVLTIDNTGHVRAVRVDHTEFESGHGGDSQYRQGFEQAAVTAAWDFMFAPARRGSQAIEAMIRYRYQFHPPSQPRDEDAPSSVSNTPRPSQTPRATNTNTNPQDEQGVTVVGRTPSREISRREVTAEEIRRFPGSRGDALLAIQNLPSVARPPFGIGQFIVRSSAPEDSLVTLEGAPITLPFHFGGFASTIATDLIERIEFLPGNFSSRYGRVAGGVINVTLRAPERDRVHLVADLDLIDFGVYGSVPIGSRASLGIGLRRSFIDAIGPLFFGGSDGTSFRQWPFYWDGQLVFDWEISRNDTLRVIASFTDDQLILNFRDPNSNDPNFRGNLGTHLSYAGVQARWRHQFSPNVIHTFAPAFGYQLTAGILGPEVSFTFQSWNFNLRDELEIRFSRRARLFIGTDLQSGWLDNSVRAPPLPTSGIMDPIDPATVVSYTDQRPFVSPSVYAETEINAGDTVRILAGVRVDYFSLLNGFTVNPRATLQWNPVSRLTLRAGYGQFSTPPRGYYIVRGFGNPDLDPESWTHLTMGANLEIIPGVLDLDTNVFVKLGDHVVAPSAGTRLETQPSGQVITVPERFANRGLGRVIGGEWMVRLRPNPRFPLYGLFSYTFQRATRSICAVGCPWNTYQYDQPHILSLVLGAILPYGWEAGLRVRYTSGLVEPVVTGALFDADHDVSLTITDPNRQGRLPAYFSLDLRVSKRFQIGPVRGQFIAEVLNTLNNSNAESRIYSYDRRTSQLVYGLPIIPSLGLRMEY